MLYKFKSKAAGDVIMANDGGELVLKALGRDPAPQGIVEVAAMPAAISALERAIADEEARRAAAEAKALQEGSKLAPAGITLRQRAWPMMEMMKRAQAGGEPIVWGV